MQGPDVIKFPPIPHVLQKLTRHSACLPPIWRLVELKSVQSVKYIKLERGHIDEWIKNLRKKREKDIHFCWGEYLDLHLSPI